MSGFALEAEVRLALDVAADTAEALGDGQCGTEHLLYGLVATAADDLADLVDLFALDAGRVERALLSRGVDRDRPPPVDGRPPSLSRRAERALRSTPAAGVPLGSFDLLVALLVDPHGGAAAALRTLGVRIGDIRGLAQLGAARLADDEVEGLVAAVDRRHRTHRPWWGPGDGADVVPVDDRQRLLARSGTAVATLDRLVAGGGGFGFTVTITSTGPWVLPPHWEPREELVPGIGSRARLEPDLVTVEIGLSDGRTPVSNRTLSSRWRNDEPRETTLVHLGSRSVVDSRNDRRRPVRRAESAEWWLWPAPTQGHLDLRIEWPAEALGGGCVLDATEYHPLSERAEGLG